MRKGITGSLPVTPSRSKVVDKAVRTPIKINGVAVSALIDAGSEVFTISQSFFFFLNNVS